MTKCILEMLVLLRFFTMLKIQSHKEDTNCSNLLNFMRSLRETQKEIWFWAHNAFIINSKSYLPQKYYFINCKSIIQKRPTKKLMKNSKNLFGREWSAEEFNGTRFLMKPHIFRKHLNLIQANLSSLSYLSNETSIKLWKKIWILWYLQHQTALAKSRQHM